MTATLQFIRGEPAALRATLQSMRMLMERGPGDAPGQFFEVLQAMLFYIDEFPERLHHPKTRLRSGSARPPARDPSPGAAGRARPIRCGPQAGLWQRHPM
ncbi:MAG TPA: hypothetical protein VGF26_27815 [Ramlibacter sp.]